MAYVINTCLFRKSVSYFLCSSWQSSSKSRYVVKRGFGTVDGEERATYRVSIRSTVRATQGWPSSGDFSALLSSRTISVFLGTRSSRREEETLCCCWSLQATTSFLSCRELEIGTREVFVLLHKFYTFLKKWAYNLCYKSRHLFACNPESWLSNISKHAPAKSLCSYPACANIVLKWLHSKRQLLFSKFPIILHHSWLAQVLIGTKKVYLKFILSLYHNLLKILWFYINNYFLIKIQPCSSLTIPTISLLLHCADASGILIT